MDPEFLDTEGEHEHDDSVTSMSITTSGEVHMLLVNDWVGDVLKNLGNDIYRMKGVLAVAGSPKKFVYQAVHMIFDGVFEGEWGPDEPRGNKLVFMAKPRKQSCKGASGLLDTPANRAKIEEAEMIRSERQQKRLSAAQRDDVVAIKNILQAGPRCRMLIGGPDALPSRRWGRLRCGRTVRAGGRGQVNDLGAQTPLCALSGRQTIVPPSILAKTLIKRVRPARRTRTASWLPVPQWRGGRRRCGVASSSHLLKDPPCISPPFIKRETTFLDLIAAAAWGGVSPNGVARSSTRRTLRNPSMSVRYLGSPALHKKTSCRGRRPLIPVDSACYIAANYRSRRDCAAPQTEAPFAAARHTRNATEAYTAPSCFPTATEEPPLRARRRRRPLPQRKHGVDGRREQGRT